MACREWAPLPRHALAGHGRALSLSLMPHLFGSHCNALRASYLLSWCLSSASRFAHSV
jgi:hypothetical protein